MERIHLGDGAIPVKHEAHLLSLPRLRPWMRTGWYHRVVEAGELGAGDAYELVERSPGAPTILEAMRAR